MKIIINADDLGYSLAINDRIFRLIETGHITSATLLTNAPWYEDAVGRLGSYPHASFGVHLNLTEFAPLTRDPAFQSLLDSRNCFGRDIRTVNIDPQFRHAVYTEWTAQVRRAIQCGVPISHFDSHHHVHTIPKLFLVLKRLQKEFGIWKVRRSPDVLGVGESMSRKRRAAKFVWHFALTTWGPTKTTNGLAGFESFYSLLPNLLPRMETIELMCHPGDDLSERETRLIESPWRAGLEDRLQLINYNDL